MVFYVTFNWLIYDQYHISDENNVEQNGDYENLGAAVYVINYSECRITDLCFFLSLTRRATDGPIVFK